VFTKSQPTLTQDRLPAFWDCPLTGHTKIFFGMGTTQKLPALLAHLQADKVIIIADNKVQNLHQASLEKFIPSGMSAHWISVTSSEAHKNWENLHDICQNLFSLSVTKSSCIITFGGGVALNIAGLAASLVLRGLPFIHIPTTLMAQSDVVISNKQSINFAGGKNRLGVYNPAHAVLIDPQWLATEPERQKKAAVVEYAKNALILGETHYPIALALLEQQDRPYLQILENSLLQKREIARRDPTEKNFGLALEYGHTFGHALEYCSQGSLLHGEAVWLGLNIAANMALKLDILSEGEYQKHQLLLNLCQPQINLTLPSRKELKELLDRDNKRQAALPGFILLEKIGKIHQSTASSNKMLTLVDPDFATEIAFQTLHALL